MQSLKFCTLKHIITIHTTSMSCGSNVSCFDWNCWILLFVPPALIRTINQYTLYAFVKLLEFDIGYNDSLYWFHENITTFNYERRLVWTMFINEYVLVCAPCHLIRIFWVASWLHHVVSEFCQLQMYIMITLVRKVHQITCQMSDINRCDWSNQMCGHITT